MNSMAVVNKNGGGKSSLEEPSKCQTTKPFYGDLVQAVAFTAVVPVSALDVHKTGACFAESELCGTALFTVFLCFLVCSLHWSSYLKSSNTLSFMAFLSALVVSAYMNLNEWPYKDECTITVQYQGALFASLCNGSLTLKNHMLRMVISFSLATYVSIQSPNSIYQQDVVPLLGGPMLMALAFLCFTKVDWTFLKHVNWNYWTVQGARWVLSAIYMYHTASQLLSMTFREAEAKDMFAAVVKAGFVACVGIAATGTFQNEIYLNKQLETLVKHRTRIISEKNDQLHMVELALKASETAIAITDSDLRIIWLNAACENISQKKQALQEPIATVLALDTIADETKLHRAFSKIRTEDELHIYGKIFSLEVSPYTYAANENKKEKETDDDDAPCNRFLVVLKNITSERAREVAEKTAQEEAMLAKAMGDSMVTLTHELRTPMQGIMGVTGMLLQENNSKTSDSILNESLRLIMASSGLLLNLINNLLDVKKVNSEMMDDFPLSPIDPMVAIKDTIDFCRPLASISGVSVVAHYGKDTHSGCECQIESNSLRLQQVLINLVSNAIKYTEEQSEISITIEPTVMAEVEIKIEQALACSRDSNSKESTVVKLPLPSNTPVLCFSISDFGPGIAPHQADRLFRRFARLDNKPTRGLGGNTKVGQPSGTGLGLNLCQMFVQRMNGEIWATNNTNGRGATFSFFLPLAVVGNYVDRQIVAPLSMTKRYRSFEDLNFGTTQIRVLLVDDVLINRKVISRMLKQIGITTIAVADSGENALCELSNNTYDLVITDLQMPGMSGDELAKAILSSPTVGCVVVGITADTSVKVADICRSSGMSTVLYKPISVVELREFFETTVQRLRPGVWHTTGRGAVLTPQ